MSDKTSTPQGKIESGPNVLIIDDSPAVTDALSRILSHEGFKPSVCHSGAEALEYARENLPAAALVDIHLPDISGLVLSAKLREHFGQSTPIIMLSGDTSIENIRSLAHVGATYFISKPFRPDHLVERLRELTAVAKP